MFVSVVIPVRNRPDEIVRAVASARASAALLIAPDRAEIIVVDNGSTDATARNAAEAGGRVVSEPLPRRTRARNRGAREAGGEWVAFLDSDCEADPQWLPALVAAFKAAGQRTGAVAGRIIDAPPETAVMEYLAKRGWFDQEKYLARSGAEPFAPRFALTANLAVRRDVYLELGGLDPDLIHAVEDADFCLRLADAGWGLEYARGAAVTHHHRADAAGLWRQAVDWGAGQAELFAKYHRRYGKRISVQPRRWSWAVKGLLKAPWRRLTGRTPFEKQEPWFDCIANAGLIWGRALTGAGKGKVVL